MKQVQVLVKDFETLELLEDGFKGDQIKLTDLQKVDLSFIQKKIAEETNSAYKKQYENQLEVIKANHQNDLDNLNSQFKLERKSLEEKIVLKDNERINELKDLENKHKIEIQNFVNEKSKFEESKAVALDTLKHDYDMKLQKALADSNTTKEKYEGIINNLKSMEKSNIDLALNDLKLEYEKKITELENTIAASQEKHKKDLSIEKTFWKLTYEEKISKLNTEIEKLKATAKSELDLEVMKQTTALNDEHSKALKAVEAEKDKVIAAKDLELEAQLEEIKRLTNQKSALSVKMIGESLETWCNNEMENYLQVGLDNCTWEKDNQVIKEEGEKKGSKADFVFKVYANELHNENELLASVCLDMKDENPNSTHKQKNSHYYDALDKNRIKKNCKYAVLVSTLESDNPNALPIYRVKEYRDMYVVQPAYMMTFLNMVKSLSMKFKDLLLKDEKEKQELIEVTELEEYFEDIKKKYLDKPLESLGKDIDEIKKINSGIKEAANKIDDKCNHVIDKYISEINNKLEKFNITKLVKKMNKIEEVK